MIDDLYGKWTWVDTGYWVGVALFLIAFVVFV